MGAGFTHKCSHCGYSISTSGPWEFYRDSQGNRKPYGHPVPISEEAEKQGIHGLSGELYCPNCDKVFNLILVEFKNPSNDTLSIWSGRCEPKEEFRQENMVKCPECGNTNMILEPVKDKVIICPRCKVGHFMGYMEWIS